MTLITTHISYTNYLITDCPIKIIVHRELERDSADFSAKASGTSLWHA
jgi:hypothetical protein